MKERSPQDQAWNQQKESNAEVNKLLADHTFWHGHFLRSTVSATQVMRETLKPFIPTSNISFPRH